MNDYVKHICKIGQVEKCCKYLVMGAGGFECMRFPEENKQLIDDLWKKDHHNAQGDNCDGVYNFDLLREKVEKTYILFFYRNIAAILCIRCGMISYNENDAKYKWCENCKKPHDDFLTDKPI